MWKDRARLIGTIAVGMLAIVGLHGVSSRVPIDWSNPVGWLNRTPIEDAVTEVVRLIGLALSYWIVISTILYVAAVLSNVPAAIRAVEWATLPAVRRVTRRVAAFTLATSMAAPAAVMLAPPAPDPVAAGADTSAELVVPFTESGQALIRVTEDGVVVPPGYQEPAPPAYEPTVGTHESSASPAAAEVAASSDQAATATARAVSYTVVDGDNLWSISERRLVEVLGGAPDQSSLAAYWVEVIDTNRSRLMSGDPDLIYPGEVIELPPVEGTEQ